MPVIDTPSNASSSVFCCHFFLRYLKSVKVACSVPNILARRTFRFSVATVSSDLTTTSERLQNWLGLNMISLHGLVPKSCSGSRLPFLAACF